MAALAVEPPQGVQVQVARADVEVEMEMTPPVAFQWVVVREASPHPLQLDV
jgi:hypothetical protein